MLQTCKSEGRGRCYTLVKVKSLKPVAEQLERFNRSIINFFLRLLNKIQGNQVHTVSSMYMGAGIIIVTNAG